jgi:hypothetical protein
MMLAALSTYHSGMPQVVIVGDRASDDTRALLNVVRRRYLPTALVLIIESSRRAALDRLLPWSAAMTQRDGRATAYVCRHFTCDAPTVNPDELDRRLLG